MTPMKSKKEIKDIFTAMDNLTKAELAMAELDPGCCPSEDECDCLIPFCTTLTLPLGFQFTPDALIPDTAKFAITKCCLRKIRGYCPVQSHITGICNMGITMDTTVLVEKVFGCINYVVSVEGVEGDCGLTLTYNGTEWTAQDYLLDPTQNRTSACATGSLCIDKIVDIISNPPDPKTCPEWTTENEVRCDQLELVEFEIIEEDCEIETPSPMPTPLPPHACTKTLKVRGKLRLVQFGPLSCCP